MAYETMAGCVSGSRLWNVTKGPMKGDRQEREKRKGKKQEKLKENEKGEACWEGDRGHERENMKNTSQTVTEIIKEGNKRVKE